MDPVRTDPLRTTDLAKAWRRIGTRRQPLLPHRIVMPLGLRQSGGERIGGIGKRGQPQAPVRAPFGRGEFPDRQRGPGYGVQRCTQPPLNGIA